MSNPWAEEYLTVWRIMIIYNGPLVKTTSEKNIVNRVSFIETESSNMMQSAVSREGWRIS